MIGEIIKNTVMREEYSTGAYLGRIGQKMCTGYTIHVLKRTDMMPISYHWYWL